MSKFFVVHGYCGPDHYTGDNGPILELSEFDTPAEVEAFHEEFLQGGASSKEASDVTFRVIEGKERKIVPVEKVTKFKLS